MNRRWLTLLGAWIAMLGCGGCAWLMGGSAKEQPRTIGATEPDVTRPVSAAELDQLTRAFADRYVGLLYSACEAVKKDNPHPAQRREAQMLLVDCASNVYDVASNANAFTQVLDLVVVATLVSQVWIDDDRAGQVFGERAEVVVRALRHGRVEAWALASQVLRLDQLDLLDYLIWDWRRQNPDMIRVSFVRFSNFAMSRGMSANAEEVATSGFLSEMFGSGLLGLLVPVGETNRAVGGATDALDEFRLLGERAFFILKRAPVLLRWQAETTKADLVTTPEIGQALADLRRLTDQVEHLPKNVEMERQAILAALDDQTKGVDQIVTNIRGALTEANAVGASLSQTVNSLNELLKTADVIAGRFDRPDTTPSTQPSRPFDIREYTEGLKELGAAAGRMNDLLTLSNELLGSSEWARRIQQVNEAADGRMAMAVDQGQRLVDRVFRGIYVALGILFVLLILNRLIVVLLPRRRSRAADNARGADEKEISA
jgi:hypothetical protein